MKRVTFAMTTIALLVAVSSAHAQEMGSASTVDFGVAGGITFPQGDVGDFTKTGWHLQGLMGWSPPTMPVAFRFDLMYHGLPGKEINLGGGSVEGPDFRVLAGTANVELDLSRLTGTAISNLRQSTAEPGSASVYLTGGVGVYNSKIEDFDSETDLGINVGGGVNFNLAGLRTFVEGRFHNIFSDGESARMIPITVGIRFGGPTSQ
ncbi:MAG TPA: outer membrane beta-barrel protein [Gemmatimonadaceae bacterium]|jgi:opacity protein-like surface antigen|nr:outer membrane beta-barrel protein [Gemmatimonadaceae bacterium]